MRFPYPLAGFRTVGGYFIRWRIVDAPLADLNGLLNVIDMDFKDIETFEDYGFELAKILHESRNKKRINKKIGG